MTAPQSTALALLRDGSRIPLSEPVKRALELFADRQYDTDVIGIEARAPPTEPDDTHLPSVGPAPAPPEQMTGTRQLELAITSGR